jgi:hypothetical protein
MDTRTKTAVARIEAVCRRHGIQVSALLKEAGIYRTTWMRWKNGDHGPTLKKWRAVTDTLYLLTQVRL